MNPPNLNNLYLESAGYFGAAAKIMENAVEFGVKVAKIIEQDKRYSPDAYSFLMNALHYTLSKLDEHRHVSGRELLYGIREYAMNQYGPMARTVLLNWGVKETMDFGEIVFKLVEAEILKRNPGDTKEEFNNIFDFRNAFDRPYCRSLTPKVSCRKKR